jgi:DNA invertase Pin-like site-specific DNA recombinase
MPNAYSYLRFSTPEQMKGDSIRRQTKLSEDYSAKTGLNLVRQYNDFGVSSFRGANRDKGALRAFLDAVESGRIERGSWLLVESLDRISRDRVSEALPRFIDLLNAGIVIATLQDGRVYDEKSADDPFQLIGSLVVMATAHEESVKKSIRTKSAWKTRREKRKKGVLCPAWLKLSPDGQTYLLIDDRVEVLKRIFEWAINGVGCYTIARFLNDEKVDPFSTKLKGKPRAGRAARGWHAASVSDLLTSRAVLGDYTPYHREGHNKVQAGDPIKEFYPEVIDPRHL